MRHFRASLASLPLLAEPLGRLPLGTWFPNVEFPKDEDHENTKVVGVSIVHVTTLLQDL